MSKERSDAAKRPLDRRVGRLLLRCPKCRRTQHTDRQEHDYPEAVRLEIVCPECDDGDFHEPFYYDENGKHICRDPDELPNAEHERLRSSPLDGPVGPESGSNV